MKSGLNMCAPAAGYRVPEMDLNNVDEKYFCASCGFVARQAMQAGECGHLYCENCLIVVLRQTNPVCVKCEIPLQHGQCFPDNFQRREIGSIRVHCINVAVGCDWYGDLRDADGHHNDCLYRRVPCGNDGCRNEVSANQLAQHQDQECPHRRVVCQHCGTFMTWAGYQEHCENCPDVPFTCDRCGKTNIPRRQLRLHNDPVNGDCNRMYCPFRDHGCSCDELFTRGESLFRHLTENAHLLLLPRMVESRPQQSRTAAPTESRIRQDLLAMEDEVAAHRWALSRHYRRQEELDDKVRALVVALSEVVDGLNQVRTTQTQEITALRNHCEPNNEITRRVNNLENKTADHEVLLVESNRSIEQANRDVGNVRRMIETVPETVRKVERRIESIEHTLALRNVTLADLEEYIKQQEFSSYDGQLLWKITEFARRRNEAVSGQQVSFYSPCFFTSRYGYKMCARIYLNGDGMGCGTHISVLFVVMRGHYDAILRWPFRQKVTFMLLDQDNAEHVIDAFRPDPNSSSFQRPRRETNIASGCPMFCSLSELNNHAYVRDDTMFLKIIVDTTDL